MSRLGDAYREGGFRGVTSTVASYVAWKAQGSPLEEPGASDRSDRLDRLESALGVLSMRQWFAGTTPATEPLVSVVLPTRDRPTLLLRAIDSVLSQAYPNWELLVIDDSETPQPLDAVNDGRVFWLTSGGRGVGAARNVGLDRAKGDVLLFLDDDNVMDPHWAKSAVVGFEINPEASILIGAQTVMPERGQAVAPTIRFPASFEWDTLIQYNFVDMGMLAQRPAPGTRFDETLPAFVDWDYLVRLTLNRDVVLLPALSGVYLTDAPGRISYGDRRALHQTMQNRLASLKNRSANPGQPGLSPDDLGVIETLVRRKSTYTSGALTVLEVGEPIVSKALQGRSDLPDLELFQINRADDSGLAEGRRFDLVFVDNPFRSLPDNQLLAPGGLIVGIDAHRVSYEDRFPDLIMRRRVGDALWIGSRDDLDLEQLIPTASLVKLGFDPPPTPPADVD
jgi:hypothetical protein